MEKKITAKVYGNDPSLVTEGVISERRLWTAVLINAIDDWRTGTLRARREAQDFLFNSDEDLETVCSGAGLDRADFRLRLSKVGALVNMEGVLRPILAA
jgi:hypothetical protein